MTYCLYSVAIGIQKKGGEIVRVVFSVHAGRSVISAARVKRRCVVRFFAGTGCPAVTYDHGGGMRSL
jgi:hypothetical protein